MEQGSVEWFAARVGKCTGSRFKDATDVLKNGEPSAKGRDYMVELVVERLTGRPVEKFVTRQMRDGTAREPEARARFEAETGLYVVECGFIEHPELLAGVSPDGLIDDEGGIEIKCPDHMQHFRNLQTPHGVAPEDYVHQIQGAMWVSERKWWKFVSFNPDFPEKQRLVVRHVKRDDAFIEKLSAGIGSFLARVDAAYEQAVSSAQAIEGGSQ